MANLPDDVLSDILSRLPVKSLMRFRCVSKSFCSLISDLKFVKTHSNRATRNNNRVNLMVECLSERNQYNYYSFDCGTWDSDCDDADDGVTAKELHFPSGFQSDAKRRFVSVETSCNRLVCFSDYEREFYLCNPSTRECVKLPDSPIQLPVNDLESTFTLLGFDYDPNVDNYKVVIIVLKDNPFEANSFECEVLVYTVGTSSWRTITREIPYHDVLPYHTALCVDTSVVNGALNWVAGHRLSKILSFDMRDEEFRVFPWPDCCRPPRLGLTTRLKMIGGCLSIVAYDLNDCFDVWSMKSYGETESWSKVYSIKKQDMVWIFGFVFRRYIEALEPLHIWDNGQVLVLQSNGDQSRLVIHDTVNRRAREVSIRKIPCWSVVDLYTEHLTSIISLMGGGGCGLEEQQKQNEKQKEKRKRRVFSCHCFQI